MQLLDLFVQISRYVSGEHFPAMESVETELCKRLQRCPYILVGVGTGDK